MKLHELKSTKGSRTEATRVGRGMASGKGKTATRGTKGQNSRSGGGVRPGFEGGQTPIFRRLPKIGFVSQNKDKFHIINLDQLEKLSFTDINKKTLVENKVIKNADVKVKILGNGKLTKKLTVEVEKVSKSAKDAIEKAGGSVKELTTVAKAADKKAPAKKAAEKKPAAKAEPKAKAAKPAAKKAATK